MKNVIWKKISCMFLVAVLLVSAMSAAVPAMGTKAEEVSEYKESIDFTDVSKFTIPNLDEVKQVLTANSQSLNAKFNTTPLSYVEGSGLQIEPAHNQGTSADTSWNATLEDGKTISTINNLNRPMIVLAKDLDPIVELKMVFTNAYTYTDIRKHLGFVTSYDDADNYEWVSLSGIFNNMNVTRKLKDNQITVTKTSYRLQKNEACSSNATANLPNRAGITMTMRYVDGAEPYYLMALTDSNGTTTSYRQAYVKEPLTMIAVMGGLGTNNTANQLSYIKSVEYNTSCKHVLGDTWNYDNEYHWKICTKCDEEVKSIHNLGDDYTCDDGCGFQYAWNFDGTDDFSSRLYTGQLWTNNLSSHVTDEQKVLLKGATDKFTLSEAAWGEGNKPLEMSFTAWDASESYSGVRNDGLKIYLLDSDDADAYLYINRCADVKATRVYYDPAKETDTEKLYVSKAENVQTAVDAVGWRHCSITRAFYSADGPLRITVKYDWSQWDENIVVLTITVEDADGLKADGSMLLTSQTATLTYTYSGTNKPEKFNVGFENLGRMAEIDDFSVSWGVMPKALGATLSSDSDDRSMPIRFGFDYETAKQGIDMEGETPIAYGAVLAAGTRDYKTMTDAADTLLNTEAADDAEGYTFIRNETMDKEDVPDMYYVTVSNSDGENIGKRVTAISYILTEKDGVQNVHYTRVVQHSPMSVLKSIYATKYLPAYTAGGAIIAGSALETALQSYNDKYDKSADLTAIQEAVGVRTTDQPQRNLLKEVHFYLNENQ